MRKFAILYLAILFGLIAACEDTKNQEESREKIAALNPVDLVFPQLDTENSRWFFFSSASRPFGMVNLIPDTQLKGTWGSGYRYEIDTVKGFSHIHGWQLSGLSVMPVTLLDTSHENIYEDFYSKFSHETEQVKPGHHSLTLDRYNIKVDLASTKRVGLHRYTFPDKSKKAILFNLNGLFGPCKVTDGNLKQSGEFELSGDFVIAPTRRRPKPVTVFFKVVLNTAISNIDKDVESGNYLLNLTNEKDTVLMKVGISYTSLENAKINLNTELPHWNFDQVVDDSQSEWNGLLNRIEIEGGTEKAQRRFYTDLWHALLGRKIISDVNGAYPDNTGADFRIGQLPLNDKGFPKFNHYNSDSFWGAQWTINTLWGLVYPEIKQEFVHSLLQYEKDGGMIPRGPSGGNYTYVMTGASSTPFVVSAIQQGIITKNLDSIYFALKKNHMPGGIFEKAGYEHYTNKGGGLNHYIEKGYVAHPNPEGNFGFHQDGASLTMEYAYQDFTLAQLAKKMGYEDDYDYFSKRSFNYKNVFDTKSNWMRPKDIAGVWNESFDPYQHESGFNESNAAQSTWFVPHNLEGLAALMGGNETAVQKLNEQFEKSIALKFTAGNSHDRELHPEYSRIPINYGNQPSIQTAFIFSKLGRPDLTQYWSNQVVSSVFSGLSTSTGYNGDEDQGLMSSLAVLMKIGLFQMDGGTMENPAYMISTPAFEKVKIKLNSSFYSGDILEISATDLTKNNSYINTILINNKAIEGFEISHKDITNGGILELKMGNKQSQQ